MTLIAAAGHAAEIAAAAFLLWRAATADLEREWERPGWALLGWLLWLRNLGLAWGLRTSRDARTDYLSISFAGDNDLVRIARSAGSSLEAAAGVFLLVGVAVPAAALLVAFARGRRAGGPDCPDEARP